MEREPRTKRTQKDQQSLVLCHWETWTQHFGKKRTGREGENYISNSLPDKVLKGMGFVRGPSLGSRRPATLLLVPKVGKQAGILVDLNGFRIPIASEEALDPLTGHGKGKLIGNAVAGCRPFQSYIPEERLWRPTVVSRSVGCSDMP